MDEGNIFKKNRTRSFPKIIAGNPEPSVKHLLYVFPIFFCSHKCFNNFQKTKIKTLKTMCFFIVLPL